MPTGSFKDRGASVMLSLLRAQGVRDGAGGQLRQWRRRDVPPMPPPGGMRATIMAPASTSPAKTVQMRAHGAVDGADPRHAGRTPPMRRCAASETVFYASHNWHPFFLQGTKTLAYELWEDLGFRAPDNVIVPCGAGSNVLGCEIGFSELLRAGEIDGCRASSRPSRRTARRSPRLPRRQRCAGRHRDQPDHRRRHRDRPADPARAKSSACCAERAAAR